MKNKYRWVEKTKAHGVAPLPKWLLPLVLKPKSTKKKAVDTDQDFDVEFFRAIGEQLAEVKFGYDDWLNIGMGLHHASGGSDEGLEIYQEISEGVNHKPGDDAEVKAKWESFDSDSDTPVTAGTFLTIAKKAGCKIDRHFEPMEYFDDETEEKAEESKPPPKSQKAPAIKKPDPKKWSIKNGREFTDDRDELVIRLNYKGFSLLGNAKAGRLFQSYKDEHGCLDVIELNNQHFRNAVAHISMREIYLNNGQKPTTKLLDADQTWLRSRDKRVYKGIIFKPLSEKGMLNLWGVHPIPCKKTDSTKGVNLVLQLIEKIMCNGNETKATYLIRYFAHIMQRPEIKTSIVPIFIGEEGTGKGCLTNKILGGILKSRYTLVDERETIKNRFNKALAYKFLIILDEACWQGDKELQGILRARTGNDTLTVEEKFGARYMVDDFARYIITANTADAVKLQASNRRYLIFENSAKYKDHPIYDRIYTAIKKDKLCQNFYTYLMGVDISEFNPHKFPKHLDDEGTETKIGDDIYRSFLYDIFEENPRPVFYKNGLRCKDFYDEFLVFKNTVGSWQKNITPKKFWIEMNKLAPLTLKRKKPIRIAGEPCNAVDITPIEFKTTFWETMRLGKCKPFNDDKIFYY